MPRNWDTTSAYKGNILLPNAKDNLIRSINTTLKNFANTFGTYSKEYVDMYNMATDILKDKNRFKKGVDFSGDIPTTVLQLKRGLRQTSTLQELVSLRNAQLNYGTASERSKLYKMNGVKITKSQVKQAAFERKYLSDTIEEKYEFIKEHGDSEEYAVSKNLLTQYRQCNDEAGVELSELYKKVYGRVISQNDVIENLEYYDFSDFFDTNDFM